MANILISSVSLYALKGLAISLICSATACGQETVSPELQRILNTLANNREFYSSHIPDFFCAEHVVSHLDTGKHFERQQIEVSDSTFRLQRVTSSTRSPLLIESRGQMRINGTASSRTELGGPLALINVFSRALDDTSSNQVGCAKYVLEGSRGSQSGDLVKIHFESVPGRPGTSGCAFAEFASGTVTFDQHTQQTTQIDVTVPSHLITTNYFGKWNLSVRYGPVALGENTYWLPQRVTSTLVPVDEENVVWWFTATYSNFHKYDVKSRILVPSQAKP